ncbi:unnamed protein product [Auanema sp. JU1783]|nr:unnamed protein product [Auanema sp. JU1783]
MLIEVGLGLIYQTKVITHFRLIIFYGEEQLWHDPKLVEVTFFFYLLRECKKSREERQMMTERISENIIFDFLPNFETN